MRLHFAVFALALLPLGAAAHAEQILGSSVQGALFFEGNSNNYFNPAFGYVPAGSGNSAGTTTTIGSGLEFAFQDRANTDTANFSNTELTVTDVVAQAAAAFEMDFSDAAFTGFTQVGGTPGFTSSFSGDTLKVFFAGSPTAGTYSVQLDYPASVTPEPSAMALFGTGLLGIAGLVRRRQTA